MRGQEYSGQAREASRVSTGMTPRIPNASRASATGKWNTSSYLAMKIGPDCSPTDIPACIALVMLMLRLFKVSLGETIK